MSKTAGEGAKKAKEADKLVIERMNGESDDKATARALLNPYARHALSASIFAGQMMGKSDDLPRIVDYAEYLTAACTKAEGGDLALVSRTLAAQAITLDSMFTEFARRAAINMGEYIHAAERYGRLALKAQSNCRATLETLAKLHQPREQIVRHVHVNEGGQAVVADQFHHHTGAEKNAESVEQSHATGSAGQCAALPCPDAGGNGVPISSGERQAAMQDARRDQSGRA